MKSRIVLHLLWGVIATGTILLEVIIPYSTNPGDWVWPFGLLPFPLAGALILSQRPGNRIGRVLAAIGAASVITFAGGWVSIYWFDAPWSPYLEALVSAPVVIMFWGLIALLYLLPDGHSLPGWPRWVFRAISIVSVVVLLLVVVRPGPMDLSSGLEGLEARDNPLGVGPGLFVGLFEPLFLTIVLGGVAGLVALIIRFRRTTGVERAQLKVFMFGAVALIVLLGLVSPLGSDEASSWDVLLGVLVIVGFWGLPAAVVAAVLRYRLFEIDRLVSRTVTYLVVVGLLGLGYAGLVVGLRALFPVEGDLPVAVSTLVVAMAFLPLARRVQRFVDRRFFRSRYDASVVVSRVAEELRGSLDLDEVITRTEAVVGDVLAPETVGIWLDPGTSA